jgi:hypothetical protein
MFEHRQAMAEPLVRLQNHDLSTVGNQQATARGNGVWMQYRNYD